jgi:hypothetical protein
MGQGRRRRAGYWIALAVGCLVLVIAGAAAYYTLSPEKAPAFVPRPTYSAGPGGLYDPGTTVYPMPSATPVPTRSGGGG